MNIAPHRIRWLAAIIAVGPMWSITAAQESSEPAITGIQMLDGEMILTHDASQPVTVWQKTDDGGWAVVADHVTTPSCVVPIGEHLSQLRITAQGSTPPVADVPAGTVDGPLAVSVAEPEEGVPILSLETTATTNAPDGSGSTTTPVPVPSALSANRVATATPSAGTSHLFWQSSDGLTVAWALTTTGAKKSGVLCYPTPIGSNWRIEAAGDINRDGTSDLIMRRTSDGTLIYWLLEADGYKRSGGAVSTAVGSDWKVEGCGDIDRDGTMDLILRRQSDGMIIYWLLNADGTKKSGGTVSTAVGSDWKVEAAGDIDRDGTTDLVLRRQSDGMIIYWLLNSNGTKKAGGTVSTAVGSGWKIEGCGDIDRDGTMDLVLRRQSDGMVIYWLLNADGTKKSGGYVSTTALGSSWIVRGAADVDKDGTVDLIISRTDNLPIVWLLNANGSKRSGASIQSTAVGTAWSIQGVTAK